MEAASLTISSLLLQGRIKQLSASPESQLKIKKHLQELIKQSLCNKPDICPVPILDFTQESQDQELQFQTNKYKLMLQKSEKQKSQLYEQIQAGKIGQIQELVMQRLQELNAANIAFQTKDVKNKRRIRKYKRKLERALKEIEKLQNQKGFTQKKQLQKQIQQIRTSRDEILRKYRESELKLSKVLQEKAWFIEQLEQRKISRSFSTGNQNLVRILETKVSQLQKQIETLHNMYSEQVQINRKKETSSFLVQMNSIKRPVQKQLKRSGSDKNIKVEEGPLSSKILYDSSKPLQKGFDNCKTCLLLHRE